MTGATLCSGIGAPEQALPAIDWLWCAEIEKFPSAVLAERHYTSVNLGNILATDFLERTQRYGPIDVLVAGTPCQSFSVAGLRGSLSDSRGNLTLRFVEIVHAIDPRFTLWENVPGVLGTKDNAFGCLLAGLVGADAPLVAPVKHPRWRHSEIDGSYFSWPNAGMVAGPKRTAAWRVLDAQYFGLAQQRERVFLISGRAGDFRPSQILFEPESVRRNTPPSREKGQGATGTLSARTKGGGGLGTDFDLGGGLSRSLRAQSQASHRADSETYIPVTSHCLNGGAE